MFSYLVDRLFWLLCHDVTILFDMWDLIYLTLAGYYLIGSNGLIFRLMSGSV